ncbi:MAG: nucleotidyltransferase domain-containing protein [Candidatus Edwardsbacteria bacterium]
MSNDTIEKIKERIISIFDKYFGEDYILFIFGSFAKNTQDIASDIDLAIYSKEIIPASVIAQVREELENKVPTLRSIDLINLSDGNLDKKLLANILKDGLIWKKGKNSKELLKNLEKRLRNLKK